MDDDRSLKNVLGIGPKKIKELKAMGIENVDDLMSSNDVTLNWEQQIGLDFYDDLLIPIPRSEVEQIGTILNDKIREIDGTFETYICGSYRRGKLTSGNINLLVTRPTITSGNLKKIGKKIFFDIHSKIDAKDCNIIIKEVISTGDVQLRLICKLMEHSRKLVIELCPYIQRHFSILHLTGSAKFNRAMRAHALSRNFHLNRYCLKPLIKVSEVVTTGNAILNLKSEREIFDFIGYPYREPNEREEEEPQPNEIEEDMSWDLLGFP